MTSFTEEATVDLDSSVGLTVQIILREHPKPLESHFSKINDSVLFRIWA